MRVFGLLSLALVSSAAAQAPEHCCRLDIRVETAAGDPIAGASVRVESGAIRYAVRTNSRGDAQSSLRSPGTYTVTVEAPGFHPGARTLDIARDDQLALTIALEPAAIRRESVTVEDRASPLEQGAPETAATGAQLKSLPERIADVRNSLPLLPGIVRTPEGRLNIGGAPEYRSTILVNSVDVTNPATGSFGATLPIDIVESVQVYRSPYLAEFGKFSSGVVAVTTRRGGERWHYELNDPTPELRIRSAHIVGVRGFTPRFAATGPVVRNRLYLAGAGSFELRKRPVYPLPFPRNEEKQQTINTYLQFDYVPAPSHFLTLSVHGAPQRANFAGLNFYTPQTAAPSTRSHDYRVSLKDDFALAGGWLLETTVSAFENRWLVGSQGSEPMLLTPVTTLGNYPFRTDSLSQRGQWGEVLSIRPVTAAGRHHMKLGAAVGLTRLRGFADALGDVYVRSLAGDALRRIELTTQPPFRVSDTDVSLFAQDGWEPGGSVRLDFGVRGDWQRVTGLARVAPRAGVAWMPFEASRTVLRSGFGWFYDRVPLLAYAWPQYPARDGLPNVIGSGQTHSRHGAFAPRSANWSAAVDHPLGNSVLLHAAWYESRSSGLLLIEPGARDLRLSGTGSARTRTLDLIARFAWYPEQTWVVSYSATRGQGDLNTWQDLAGDFPDPVIRPNVYAGLPGIVPHRLLTWGVFPVRYGLRFSPMIEWRSGFPYSPLDTRQEYAGVPNLRRFPQFFSFDARLGKDIAMRGHKVRISFSMFNITDHGNFDAVRLNVADPQFGEWLGRRPRRFRLDFDWLF